jgi:hypothetical protein
MIASMPPVTAASIATAAIAATSVATSSTPVCAKARVVDSRQFRRYGPILHHVRSCVQPDRKTENPNYAKADHIVDRNASSEEHGSSFSRVYKLR